MAAGAESKEIQAMRHMAWERAKGELRSMLYTFYPAYTTPGSTKADPNSHDELGTAISEFIKHVEDNGLHE